MNDCICQHVGYCDGSCQHPKPAVKDLVSRLKEPLPVCPFDRRSPHYFTKHQNGEPCFVCGTTETGLDMCRMADTSIMDEAAAEIERLKGALEHWRQEVGKLHSQVDRLEHILKQKDRMAETSRTFWVRAAKKAMAPKGDFSELLNRVDLAEAAPLPIILSDEGTP